MFGVGIIQVAHDTSFDSSALVLLSSRMLVGIIGQNKGTTALGALSFAVPEMSLCSELAKSYFMARRADCTWAGLLGRFVKQ